MTLIRDKMSGWSNNILYVIAFTLPFIPKYQLSFLLALVLLLVFKINKNHHNNAISGNWPAFGLIVFYSYHVVGLLWTEDYKAAALDLQIKLPFLVFPLVVIYGRLIDQGVKQKIYSLFVSGLEVAIYCCLIRSCYLYFYLDYENYIFFYKELSCFIHPGYFAMYLCFGSVLLFQRLVGTPAGVKYSRPFQWFRLALFTCFIILLSSKAGIFTQLLLLLVAVVLTNISFSGKRKKEAILLGSLFVMLAYFGLVASLTSVRMNEMEDTISKPGVAEVHSSAMRLQAWETAVQVIVEFPFSGTGTGDSKSALIAGYLKNGFTESYDQKLNAHNQYLQTAVALGIPALLLLTSLLIYGFYKAVSVKNWLLLTFLVITGFNFMIEATLEVSAGTLFFGLFYILLYEEQ